MRQPVPVERRAKFGCDPGELEFLDPVGTNRLGAISIDIDKHVSGLQVPLFGQGGRFLFRRQRPGGMIAVKALLKIAGFGEHVDDRVVQRWKRDRGHARAARQCSLGAVRRCSHCRKPASWC